MEERRRSAEPPGVKLLGPGWVLLTNSDTCWSADLVLRIFQLDPEANAYWKREHPLERDVELKTPDIKTAAQAAVHLLYDLQCLKVAPDGAVDCRVGSTVSFANLVRRALMTRIRVLAVEQVTVLRNSSGVLDEILAHRIGQLAIQGQAASSGETGTTGTTGKLTVSGRQVRGGDLIFESVKVAECDAQVILAPLHHDAQLQLSCTLRSGTALEHAKFSAVRAVPISQRHVLSAGLPSTEKLESLMAAGFVVGTNFEIRRPDCLPVRIERVQEVAGPLEIKQGDTFHLLIEPLGQLSAEQCLQKAVEAVSAEINDYLRLLCA
jgi:hypothetical protein